MTPTSNICFNYKLHGRQVYDSRGKPTVEAEIELSDGSTHSAIVPSGASTGKYEALELRDKDPVRNLGQSVNIAVNNINEIISQALLSKNVDITNQEAIDRVMIELDGTPNKGRLGANAILAVSMAACRAAAHIKGVTLYQNIASLTQKDDKAFPIPCFNVINGGVHAGNLIPFQEFMIVPIGASSFHEAMEIGSNIYQRMKSIMHESYGIGAINVGDEGGFAPLISNIEECLDFLMKAIKATGYEGRVKIALDVAASEFYSSEGNNNGYNLSFKDAHTKTKNVLSGKELGELYASLCEKYPILSIEDPFDQDDWQSWVHLRKLLPQMQIVGDDLTVTNPSRISEAIKLNACNCLLLKINQIGTISEAIQSAKIAMGAGWEIMVSHRSGETEDNFIADLAVGLGAKYIKSGAPCRSERVAKYNRLLRIEEGLQRKYAMSGSKTQDRSL